MSGFTSVGGGNNVNPTNLSYLDLALTADVRLQWPRFIISDDAVPCADKIDVTPDAPGRSVFLPDATLATVGEDVFVRNLGASTISILDFDGGVVAVVTPGQVWYVYLVDNATDEGEWHVIQMGTGSSTADAASLAGLGLKAIGSTLNTQFHANAQLSDYAVAVNDRASVIINGGGSVTYSLSGAAMLGDGWFFVVRNSGSGTITIDPDGAETIDDAATKVLNPSESCIVVCNGSEFYTVGYGRSITSTVAALNKSIAGTGTIALTPTEVQAEIQNFTGLLTGNRVVEYGTSAGYWFVYNNTTGAFTTTLRVNGGDPGAVVAQGNYSIVRSDGTNMTVAFTATSGTVTQVNTGTGLTGGPITSTGTINLANTAVTIGTYGTNAAVGQFTVDAQGRLTGAANVAISPGAIGALPLTAGAGFPLTGDLYINKSGAALVLNSTGGSDNLIDFRQSGNVRFNIGYSAGGGYFYINRYNAGGVYLGTSLIINPLSGDASWTTPNFGITGNLGVTGTGLVQGQLTTFASEMLISNPSFARLRTNTNLRTWTAGTNPSGSYDINDESGVATRLRIVPGGGLSIFSDLFVSGLIQSSGEIRAYNDASFRMARSGAVSYFQYSADDWMELNDSTSVWNIVIAGAARLQVNTTGLVWMPAGHTFLLNGIVRHLTFPTGGLPSAAVYSPAMVARTDAPGTWAFTNDAATWKLPTFT